jgi:TatD DNase family protein
MKIVDVHCHLDDSRFDEDLDEVLKRFKDKGGEVLVSSGVNKISNRRVLKLSRGHEIVRAAFGVYPIDALAGDVHESVLHRKVDVFDVDEELDWIKEHRDECFGVGEIGLDYNWEEFSSKEMKGKQKEVFRKCLRLAKEIDKVVIIHSRKAEADAIEILEEEGMERVVMHCFNGKKALIRRCVENGWSFSVPAVITRLEHFKMLVEMVPLGQLVTETDAPYLSPIAGKRNESANVLVTLKEIARIKGLGVKGVAEKVWENFERLFY